jgi:small-conductance mechanosensitive channel
VREVTGLLARAVDEHGKILKRPAPVILFTDFGDNALLFEVHFWIHMRTQMERRSIESDVRHRLDQLLGDGHRHRLPAERRASRRREAERGAPGGRREDAAEPES